jgi:hypothetical protein
VGVPLRPRSKVPAFTGWQEQATRDPHQIRRWFSRSPYNIGISAGPSNLLVIDLDDRHGPHHPMPSPWRRQFGPSTGSYSICNMRPFTPFATARPR